MRSPAFLLIACLLCAYVEGVAIAPKSRCLCMDAGVTVFPRRNIKKVEVYYPGSSCPSTEIIVTLKNGGGFKCLNPESKFAKNFIMNSLRKKRSQG